MLEIDVSEVLPGTNRVVLRGRLDAAGAEASELRFTAAVGAAGRDAVVNMTEVPFVASLGIRVLLATARVLQRKGRRMVLYGAPPQVMDVFDIVALGKMIPLAPDEAQALALLAA